MTVIKARTRGKHLIRLHARVDRETYETLHAYAQFLGEPPDYVIEQLIDTVLAKDKEYAPWRKAHPESFVPRPVVAARRRRLLATAVAGQDGGQHSVLPREPR